MALFGFFKTKGKDVNLVLDDVEPNLTEEQKKIQREAERKEAKELANFSRWQHNSQDVSKRYYDQLWEEVQPGWSRIFQSKDYTGVAAQEYEVLCRENISLYKQMKAIDNQYGFENTALNVPAYTRLVMLYQRQGKYEKAMEVCVEAMNEGVLYEDMASRLPKLAKKANRELTDKEKELIGTIPKRTIDRPVIKKDRQKLDGKIIDERQATPASEAFQHHIWNKYYKGYEVKPFVSRDREDDKKKQWEEMADDPSWTHHALIPPQVMVRYDNGLLPGHIYLLHWIANINKNGKRRIPGYFEYQYGIYFQEAKNTLIAEGYIKNGKLTNLGILTLEKYHIVVDNHSCRDVNKKWQLNYKV